MVPFSKGKQEYYPQLSISRSEQLDDDIVSVRGGLRQWRLTSDILPLDGGARPIVVGEFIESLIDIGRRG